VTSEKIGTVSKCW